MKKAAVWTIKGLGVPGIAAFLGLTGIVWGVLSGLIILSGYVQGWLTEGDLSLLETGLTALIFMILYGGIGGVAGGTLIGILYNRALGGHHGIRLEAESE